MVLKPGASEAETGAGRPWRWPLLVWRELLLPVGVVAALLLLAVALIEGPALQQFLYAVF